MKANCVRRPWVLMWAMCFVMALTGCGTVPATGERTFILLSPGDERALGRQATPDFIAGYGGPIPSQRLQNHVTEIGRRVTAATMQDPAPIEWEWEFHALDSSVPNAFAIPGGKVFITRGLLERMENDAQLAAVLGHEAGHITARHSGQQLSKALGLELIAGIFEGLSERQESEALKILGIGARQGGALFLLKFSRDDELQADELGLVYMTRAGYHPVGMLELLGILDRMSQGPRPPELLSTHPMTSRRITEAENWIRDNFPEYENPEAGEWGFDSFERNVATPIKQLPPPRHRG